MEELAPRTLVTAAASAEPMLPTGTVTLLLADVEGSTRLWEAEPETMAAAVAELDACVAEMVASHGGVRPVEQGEGDSFVAAFTRASDAVACALDLQRVVPPPLRLRMGVHTGEVGLRGEGNYAGAAINRCARLRDIAHGGQVVVSRATHDVVVDRLPDGASFLDLGVHRLRDLARPEHVHQLCHPDLPASFPPLQSLDAFRHNLPVQLTSFVGRGAECVAIVRLMQEHRLVTLVGSGGCGKTRLAVQVAADVMPEHPDGLWHVDLVPVTDASLVPNVVARAIGLHDEQGRSTVETIVDHLAGRRALVVLDNCEHLIDASAALADAVLRGCPSVSLLATSREPLGVEGEVMWRVPSLAGEEALQLFTERAQRARPGFELNEATAAAAAEVCKQLDGIPLAIELAAARMRALSPEQIVEGLQDRFRLLTGGARTAVPRQQTLWASVDWSHELLTDPERTVLRRLAVLSGTFDLEAAESVASGDGIHRHQVLDQVALLVDKSLVMTIDVDGVGRYRMLETVRQFALERLSESGEALAVRRRHRDHYLAFTEHGFERSRSGEHDRWMSLFDHEIDNLRTAFHWSIDNGDVNEALRMATSLQLLWRRRYREGRQWLQDALAAAADSDLSLRIEAMATSVRLEAMALVPDAEVRATELLALVEQIDDTRLQARGVQAASYAFVWSNFERALSLLERARELAVSCDDEWILCDALGFLGNGLANAGFPSEGEPILRDGAALALQVGNRNRARQSTALLALAIAQQGRLHEACDLFRDLLDEGVDAGDRLVEAYVSTFFAWMLAWCGEIDEATRLGTRGFEIADDEGVALFASNGLGVLAAVHLAAGDAESAATAAERLLGRSERNVTTTLILLDSIVSAILLARGAAEARAVFESLRVAGSGAGPFVIAQQRLAEARIARAEGDLERAESQALEALRLRHHVGEVSGIADTLELLADLADRAQSHQEAARLLGAAAAARASGGVVRFKSWDAFVTDITARLRDALGEDAFDRSYAEGEALTVDEAVAYAQRGRGERKRPTFGWASLTPMERDVAALVAEGLPNKDVAAKLFISPRTVQAHLTHVYAKLGLTSRSQLAKAVADRA